MKKAKETLSSTCITETSTQLLAPELQELIRNVGKTTNTRILRLPDMKGKTGHAPSTTWKYVKNGGLPPPIRLGPRSVGWLESEIDAIIAAQVIATRSKEHVDMKTFVSLLVSANATARRDYVPIERPEVANSQLPPAKDDEWGNNDPMPSDEEVAANQHRLSRLNKTANNPFKAKPISQRTKAIDVTAKPVIRKKSVDLSISSAPIIRPNTKAKQ